MLDNYFTFTKEDFINNKVIYMLEILVQRNSVDDQRTPQNELLRDDPHSFFPTSYVILIIKVFIYFISPFVTMAMIYSSSLILKYTY